MLTKGTGEGSFGEGCPFASLVVGVTSAEELEGLKCSGGVKIALMEAGRASFCVKTICSISGT